MAENTNTEREAFIQHWEDARGNAPLEWEELCDRHKVETPECCAGRFFTREAQSAWEAWQARASLSLPAAGQEPPPIHALMCVISSLRDTAHFSDEEGEVTDDLRKLRDWIVERVAAPQPAAPVAGQEPVANINGQLYAALGNLFSYLGAEGCVTADHAFVWDAMAALKRIDGGIHLDDLAVPVDPDAHRDDMLKAVQLLEDGEWAEHFAKTPIGMRLEDQITKLHGELNEATSAAPQPAVAAGWVDGIQAAAKLLEKKADDFAQQHGYDDMGSLSFGRGAHADAKLDYHSGLLELAEEIRALPPAPSTEGESNGRPNRSGQWPHRDSDL